MSSAVFCCSLILCFLCLLWPTSVSAQEPPLWPGAKYDPAIPTIKSVLGHDHGEVITPPEGVAQYLQALQKAAPTKSRLIQYATTWEGRPLWLFVIGSPDRIAKLDQIKADIQRFADPRRTPAADGDRLARELPVVVWLDARRPRQRDLVRGCRAGRGVSPARLAGRRRRRCGPPRRARADRSDAEPRRPRALHRDQLAGTRDGRRSRRRTRRSTTSRGRAGAAITISST